MLRGRALVSRRKGDASTIDCYRGGNAVQGIYAHRAGTDDYSTYTGYLQAYAAAADSVFQGSAAEQGGSRQLRWVTDSSCNPSILDVTISGSASGDFTTMIDELRDRGFTDPSRKYLVWLDGSNTYCGIGQYYGDSSPDQGNHNNGAVAMFARVDNPAGACWQGPVPTP